MRGVASRPSANTEVSMLTWIVAIVIIAVLSLAAIRQAAEG